MLELSFPSFEGYDDIEECFFTIEGRVIHLEHSLSSLAKWESKWRVPFMQYEGTEPKTIEQMVDYVRCMTLDDDVDPRLYSLVDTKMLNYVIEYINEPMTATWFKETGSRRNRSIVTAEVIYYWMVTLQIPFECQYWHLNRLLTLIRVCNEKNAPSKKMRKSSQLRQQAELNAKRKAQHRTHG